jgi:hypothetical protein
MVFLLLASLRRQAGSFRSEWTIKRLSTVARSLPGFGSGFGADPF